MGEQAATEVSLRRAELEAQVAEYRLGRLEHQLRLLDGIQRPQRGAQRIAGRRDASFLGRPRGPAAGGRETSNG